jgi:2'-5' RNA ligase
LRLFVAICLPDAWHTALRRQQEELRQRLGAAAGALRWVRPEGCHLTLVFLGETPAMELPRITAALSGTAQTPPFTLRLGGPGTFGGARPRVVHTGVAGDVEALALVQRRVAEALHHIAERPFSAHITLARVPQPDRATGSAIAAALARPLGDETPPFTVDRISLMRSELHPGGAVYTELFAARLAGTA